MKFIVAAVILAAVTGINLFVNANNEAKDVKLTDLFSISTANAECNTSSWDPNNGRCDMSGKICFKDSGDPLEWDCNSYTPNW